MKVQKKCSLEEHKDINAIFYCQKCEIYMCNKCENYHSPFLKHHHVYKIDLVENEIFTGYCKEKNHPDELKYFCKIHNQLCCAACIAKIDEAGDGQHKDCDIYTVDKIKEEKRKQLTENIKSLEDLENKFKESFEEIKDLFKQIEKNKEELKLEVQKIFTKIRNSLNDREDELLIEIDNIFDNKYINEDIIKKGEKSPKKIKESLEKGKLINQKWNDDNALSNINDCINIENNIKEINIIKEGINKCKTNNKIKIDLVQKKIH